MKQMPKYQSLADSIRKKIQEGVYPDGYVLDTENDLAKQYGMSRQTVRHALSILETEGILERKRGSGTFVKQKRLLRKKTMTVGVIVSYISEYIFPTIIRGIEAELALKGYAMKLSATSNCVDNERRILMDYQKQSIDGLIIEGTKTHLPNPNISIYRELAGIGIPYVFINGYYPEIQETAYVVTDDYHASKQAVQYLAKKGHRQIAGIFKSDDMQGVRRYQGYIEGLIEQELIVSEKSIIWFTTNNFDYIFNSSLGEMLLTYLEGCTAVVCYNDYIAVLLFDIIQKAGKRVPDDIAIISFDNSVYSDINTVKITSMNHPKEELGRIASRQLIQMIDGKKSEQIILPMELVEKESS